MLLGVLNGCAWLDAKQRQVIYRPTPGLPADFAGLRAGDERYFLEVPQTGGARVALWWLPSADKNAPTLLYLHGTFRTLFHNLHKMEALREAGFSVLAVDYRGWGESTLITPSERSIVQDAEAVWAELQRREPRAAQRVLYGHSMGSGVAVHLASRRQAPADYGALILESSFTSFAELASEAGLLPRLIACISHERFDSLGKIKQINAPLLVIHGRLDNTVPVQLAQKLFMAANPPKQWLVLETGGHSDLNQVDPVQYQSVLRGFKNTYLPSP